MTFRGGREVASEPCRVGPSGGQSDVVYSSLSWTFAVPSSRLPLTPVASSFVAVAVAVARCAVKVPKTVEMWAEELKTANAAVNGGTDTKVQYVQYSPPGDECRTVDAACVTGDGCVGSRNFLSSAGRYRRCRETAATDTAVGARLATSIRACLRPFFD